MPETNPSPPLPAAATGTAAAGPDEGATTPTADGAAIRASGGMPFELKLSAEWGEHAEIAPVKIDSSNSDGADDDNESEMDAHTPPTHDDRDRTAVSPTDAAGAARGRQGPPAPRRWMPHADPSAGDESFTPVTATTPRTAT